MRKLVFEFLDGTVSTFTPSPDAVQESGFSEDEFLTEVQAAVTPTGADYVGRVNDADMPNMAHQDYYMQDGAVIKRPVNDNKRHFRSAWEWNGAAIIENTEKVKAQRAKNCRAIRNELLKNSDVVMTRETEQAGPNVNALKNYRQALRDMGAAIDASPENVSWPVSPV